MSKSARMHRRRLRLRRKATVRTMPGTIKPDPTAPPPKIHVIAYGPDAVEERDVANVDEIETMIGKQPVMWINVDGLGDADVIQKVGALFKMHPLALEDVVNVHQRPKLEEYDQHLFVVAQMMSAEEDVSSEQISLFFGPNFVLTFQERPGDTFDSVRLRIRKNRGRIRTVGADYLAYCLLDSIVDGYFPILEQVGQRIDHVESLVDASAGPDTLTQLHALRNELLYVRRSVWPLRDALSAMVREANPLIKEDTRVFLRDCYDHTVQIIDLGEVYRELCGDLRDYVLSIVSQRTNDIMKVLTIIATIFIPLSFITGLYGMNFDTQVSEWNMPELKWTYGYLFALGLMVAVALAMLAYFLKKRWIGRDWFFPDTSFSDKAPDASSPEPVDRQ